MKEGFEFIAKGFLTLRDTETNEVLLQRKNMVVKNAAHVACLALGGDINTRTIRVASWETQPQPSYYVINNLEAITDNQPNSHVIKSYTSISHTYPAHRSISFTFRIDIENSPEFEGKNLKEWGLYFNGILFSRIVLQEDFIFEEWMNVTGEWTIVVEPHSSGYTDFILNQYKMISLWTMNDYEVSPGDITYIPDAVGTNDLITNLQPPKLIRDIVGMFDITDSDRLHNEALPTFVEESGEFNILYLTPENQIGLDINDVCSETSTDKYLGPNFSMWSWFKLKEPPESGENNDEQGVNNAKPWKQQYDFNFEDNGDITGWTTGTSLPGELSLSQAIVTNNRVYLLGGSTSSGAVSTVYTAPINSDGTLGTWTTGTSLPEAMYASQAIVTNNRVYLLGGFTGSAAVSTVYTAPINSDGTLGTWTTGTSLPGVVSHSQAIVTNNRVYLLGGHDADSTVYTAPINSDGTLGTWTTGTSLPGELSLSQAIVTNNRVYLLGGSTSSGAVSTVYTAPINSDGTLGAWTTGTSLPEALFYSQAIVTNSRVYLLGGYTSSAVSTVYTAPINSDGTLGTWTTGTSLPGGLYISQAIVTNSRVYLLGGPWVYTVYEAPFSGGKNDYLDSTIIVTEPDTGEQVIFSKWNKNIQSKSSYKLFLQQNTMSGELDVNFIINNNGEELVLTTGLDLSDSINLIDTWIFALVRFNALTKRLEFYLNGDIVDYIELETNIKTPVTDSSNDTNFIIGSQYSGVGIYDKDSVFKGIVDEIAILPEFVNQFSIQTLWNNGYGNFYAADWLDRVKEKSYLYEGYE